MARSRGDSNDSSDDSRRSAVRPDRQLPMTSICPACAAPASGNFCNSCGSALGPRTCRSCQAQLSPQARFCHRCGEPVNTADRPSAHLPIRPSDRTPWIIAGSIIVLALAAIIYTVGRNSSGPLVPDMANNGASINQGSADPAARPAPDISNMTPRERFDRLFDRIMTAAENNDSATVVRFSPMALGAYNQLDRFDADARYHAAMIHLSLGEIREVSALADTILKNDPGHLFGYVLRGNAAEAQNHPADLKKAYADFLSHYDVEMKANRQEYREHGPVIEDFHRRATTQPK